jgi:hypothetical protein
MHPSNGVPNFPGPKESGGRVALTIGNGGGINPNRLNSKRPSRRATPERLGVLWVAPDGRLFSPSGSRRR